MEIDFQCGSILEFDSEQQRYKKCQANLSVDQSLGGTFINCPTCGNEVEVPFQMSLDLDEPSESGEILSELPVSSVASQLQAAQPLPSGSQLSHRKFTRSNTCRNCGGTIQKGMGTCPRCNMPLPADMRADDGDELKITHALTGFQLWFSKLFNSDSTEHWNVSILAINIAIGAIVATVSFVLLVFAGPLGVIFVSPVIVLAVCYILTILKWREFRTNPEAQLQRWQRLVWLSWLQFQRLLGWKTPFSKITNPKVLDLRGETISDSQLIDLPGLGKHHVIDLTNQSITDQGLKYLHQRKHLQYIVLNGTNVTHVGVFRLQQAIPKAFIWF